MKVFPRPNGDVQGDSKPCPDKGTGTGVTHHGQMDHGKNTSVNATNTMGKITGATKSDPAFRNMPMKGNG